MARRENDELIYNSMVSAHQFLSSFPCNLPADGLRGFSAKSAALMNR